MSRPRVLGAGSNTAARMTDIPRDTLTQPADTQTPPPIVLDLPHPTTRTDHSGPTGPTHWRRLLCSIVRARDHDALDHRTT